MDDLLPPFVPAVPSPRPASPPPAPPPLAPVPPSSLSIATTTTTSSATLPPTTIPSPSMPSSFASAIAATAMSPANALLALFSSSATTPSSAADSKHASPRASADSLAHSASASSRASRPPSAPASATSSSPNLLLASTSSLPTAASATGDAAAGHAPVAAPVASGASVAAAEAAPSGPAGAVAPPPPPSLHVATSATLPRSPSPRPGRPLPPVPNVSTAESNESTLALPATASPTAPDTAASPASIVVTPATPLDASATSTTAASGLSRWARAMVQPIGAMVGLASPTSPALGTVPPSSSPAEGGGGEPPVAESAEPPLPPPPPAAELPMLSPPEPTAAPEPTSVRGRSRSLNDTASAASLSPTDATAAVPEDAAVAGASSLTVPRGRATTIAAPGRAPTTTTSSTTLVPSVDAAPTPPSTPATGPPDIPLVAKHSKNAAFHGIFKSLPLDEFLIEDFSCALQKEILVQGRLYLTERHLAFHAVIFGWVTSVLIPLSEVTLIEKKVTALIFPNAIEVHTRHQRYFFASFIFRELAFNLMCSLWRKANRSVAASPYHPDRPNGAADAVDARNSGNASPAASGRSNRSRSRRRLFGLVPGGSKNSSTAASSSSSYSNPGMPTGSTECAAATTPTPADPAGHRARHPSGLSRCADDEDPEHSCDDGSGSDADAASGYSGSARGRSRRSTHHHDDDSDSAWDLASSSDDDDDERDPASPSRARPRVVTVSGSALETTPGGSGSGLRHRHPRRAGGRSGLAAVGSGGSGSDIAAASPATGAAADVEDPGDLRPMDGVHPRSLSDSSLHPASDGVVAAQSLRNAASTDLFPSSSAAVSEVRAAGRSMGIIATPSPQPPAAASPKPDHLPGVPCTCEHHAEVVFDTPVPHVDPETLFAYLYSDASAAPLEDPDAADPLAVPGFGWRILAVAMKCTGIDTSPWSPPGTPPQPGATRALNYVMPLNIPIPGAPKQTGVKTREEVVAAAPGKLAVAVTTETPDVMNGNCFAVHALVCMSRLPGGQGTQLKVSVAVKWSKSVWMMKGAIEGGAVDGQRKFWALVNDTLAPVCAARAQTASPAAAVGELTAAPDSRKAAAVLGVAPAAAEPRPRRPHKTKRKDSAASSPATPAGRATPPSSSSRRAARRASAAKTAQPAAPPRSKLIDRVHIGLLVALIVLNLVLFWQLRRIHVATSGAVWDTVGSDAVVVPAAEWAALTARAAAAAGMAGIGESTV
ncbi:hypothetical protein H9P43_005724 [Blastocladiella emersonii ATCC 22665]|nr:hypothetical protein H9P43_005724 [Blastocladiella emersonii ATCC 22665]